MPLYHSNTQGGRRDEKKLLQYLFEEALPKYGMKIRKSQIELALEMLESIIENKVALCEAEVGTGKTHAYILAVVVYKIIYKDLLPAMISTSTIALQKAITEQYLPQLSKILLKEHMMDRELSFLIKKGKSHYACENRVKDYYCSILHNNRVEDRELIYILRNLYQRQTWIDLDELALTPYIKRKICVEHCSRRCGWFETCRYQMLMKKAQGFGYDFQILNHNMLLADILGQKSGRAKLFPTSSVVVFDEAHQMIHAARQMYSICLEQGEFEHLLLKISNVLSFYPESRREIVILCKKIESEIQEFFEWMKISYSSYRKGHLPIEFNFESVTSMRRLVIFLERISILLFSDDAFKIRLSSRILYDLEQLKEKLLIFLEQDNFIYWLEHTGVGQMKLYSLPKQLYFLLYEDLWEEKKPYIFTSGTLSIHEDFTHFKRQIGLDFLEEKRMMEVSKHSPFDYWNHGLLYLPEDLPSPNGEQKSYKEKIKERLIELINQTYGHTLVLFTSYRMMEQMYYEISGSVTSCSLFCMGKGRLETLEQFRKSGNGVLFASDSAGEGIDLAGDIVSSVIVVKLPFPIPDPVSEYECSLYDNFHDYLSSEIIPNMLIKLKQWIGRGIRRENDTCVFSILDSRANERYRSDILNALPKMPVTNCMEDIGRFLLEKKDKEYFSHRTN